jgi:hypothetical protein
MVNYSSSFEHWDRMMTNQAIYQPERVKIVTPIRAATRESNRPILNFLAQGMEACVFL